MRVEARSESLWRTLIWPTLWPLLVVQAGLVILSILAWAVLTKSAMPPQQALRGLTWLVLALLLGTGLIVATFLLLLRHRLQRWEVSFGVPHERLERAMRELHKELPSWLKSRRLVPNGDPSAGPVVRLESLLDGLEALLERFAERPHLVHMLERVSRPAFITHHNCLVAANNGFEKLMGRSFAEMRGLDLEYLMRADNQVQEESIVRLHDGQGNWRTYRLVRLVDHKRHMLGILEDLNEQQQRLAKVTLLRDRAREESRLKSSYLVVLQRELDDVMQYVTTHMDTQQDVRWHDVLCERLADLATLVANLAGPGAAEFSDAVSLDEIETESLSVEHDPSREHDDSTGRVRILIVDDGPVNTMLARRVLEARGLSVDAAQSGEMALELAERHHYDLVFMDIVMPDPDGVETSRRWRTREAERGESNPSVLIALTANAGNVDRERFFNAGMNDFLPKPYRPQALFDMVGRWLPDVVEDTPR